MPPMAPERASSQATGPQSECLDGMGQQQHFSGILARPIISNIAVQQLDYDATQYHIFVINPSGQNNASIALSDYGFCKWAELSTYRRSELAPSWFSQARITAEQSTCR